MLQNEGLCILGDQSSGLEKDFYQKRSQIFMLLTHKGFRKELNNDQDVKTSFVINPNHPLKIFWDFIGMLIIFIQMIEIPIIVTFTFTIDPQTQIFLDIMDYFFMVDIVLNFQTGYFNKGNYVSSRKKILINYCRLWFWIDLVSTFPLDQVITAISNDQENTSSLQQKAQILKFLRFVKFIKILRLIRVLKLKKILNQLEDYLSLDSFITSCLSFIKLCVIIMCFAHWIACIWNLIITNDLPSDIDWFSNYCQLYSLNDFSWTTKYLVGLYFSVTTMVTIGYGDVYPYTTNERVFGTFVMIFSSGLFGYIMNSIVVLFQNQDEETQQAIEKNDVMIKYMKQKQVDRVLQSRIKSYLEWLVNQEQIARKYEQITISNLSSNLKHEILIQVQGKFVKNLHFIINNFPQSIVKKISFLLTEKIHGPEEYIFQDDQQIDENISVYYIQNGQVAIKCVQTVKKLKKSSIQPYFGQISFIANVPRTASVKTISFVNLLVLSRGVFLKALSEEDLQKWFEMKFAIEYDYNLQHLDMVCYICKNSGHVAKYCPKVHYQIQKSEILQIVKKTQADIKFRLRHNKKHKSLLLLKDPYFQQANEKVKQEMENIKYYLQKKGSMTRIIHRLDIRESLTFDVAKTFSSFNYQQNLQQLIKLQNEQAERVIQKMKTEKNELLRSQIKRPKKKILSVMKKAMNINLSGIKTNSQLLRRQSSESNSQKARLLQLKQKPRRSESMIKFIPNSQQHEIRQLTLEQIDEVMEENLPQKLNEPTRIARSKKSSCSTLATQNFPDLFEPIQRLRRRSYDPLDDRKLNLPYSKKVIENMIFIVINHKLYNFK
ncbi:hypothetical protein pb186bvf_012592 [Paramecium bursaria]